MGIDPIWIFRSVCEGPDVNHRAATSRKSSAFYAQEIIKKKDD